MAEAVPHVYAALAVAESTISVPVTVTQNDRTWILDDGIVRATIDKKTATCHRWFITASTSWDRAVFGSKHLLGR
jgi:hypothetical protein